MSNNGKLRLVGYIITAFYLCFIFLSFVVAIILAYVVACFIQNKSPIDADLRITPTIEQGGVVDVTWYNVVRHKVCAYRRNFTVVSGSHYWTSDEIAATPATSTVGPIQDFTYSVDLPDSFPAGPATFYAIIRYSCPNNIVQYFNPYRVVWQQQILVTTKKELKK